MPSNHLILCCLLLLLPSLFPSIRVFSSESALRIRWPEYWSFSFNTSECSGLISFRIDCFDLLAVQGTLRSLLQHHSSKALVLQHSALLTRVNHGSYSLVRMVSLKLLSSISCPVFSPFLTSTIRNSQHFQYLSPLRSLCADEFIIAFHP